MTETVTHPVTPAIRALRAAGVPFIPHVYEYEEKGGTRHSAEVLGVDEHCVVKTLVMQDERAVPLIVLMHGDCQVSTKALARHIGCKTVTPCTPEVALKHTGYKVGGTSPFGTKKTMPTYCEATILKLERLHINGGGRGFLVSITPTDLQKVVKVVPVEVAIPG